MREILFRGKRESDGKWLYRLYADDTVCDADFPCIMPLRLDEYDNEGGADGDWAVLEETVSQYTGLTDKNGTKVFEGDILELTYDGEKTPYLIKWDKFDCCYRIWEPDKAYDYCDCRDSEMFEVIDNIFDTPRFFIDGTSYDEI